MALQDSAVNNVTKDMLVTAPDDQRDAILFVSGGYKGNKHSETNPLAVISADMYQHIFHTSAPLTRMLRRQINYVEYIALSAAEFNYLANNSKVGKAMLEGGLNVVYFVVPVMKQVHGGYFETQMQLVYLGKITEAKVNGDLARESVPANSFTVYFEGKPTISLNASNEFIRWVGL